MSRGCPGVVPGCPGVVPGLSRGCPGVSRGCPGVSRGCPFFCFFRRCCLSRVQSDGGRCLLLRQVQQVQSTRTDFGSAHQRERARFPYAFRRTSDGARGPLLSDQSSERQRTLLAAAAGAAGAEPVSVRRSRGRGRETARSGGEERKRKRERERERERGRDRERWSGRELIDGCDHSCALGQRSQYFVLYSTV